MIPKILHFCWLGPDPYPPLIVRCIDSWHRLLPDWDFKLWDKNCIDLINSTWVREAFQTKSYAFAADYIRLWAVYLYGGFYLDTDVEVLRDFSPLLSLPYVFGLENVSGKIEGATFGSEPGNKLIKDCLSFYDREVHFITADGKRKEDLILPLVMSSVFTSGGRRIKVIQEPKEFILNNEDIQVFSKEYFSPKNYIYKDYRDLRPYTFSIHHFNASWMSKKKKFSLFLRRILPQGLSEPLFWVWNKIRSI